MSKKRSKKDQEKNLPENVENVEEHFESQSVNNEAPEDDEISNVGTGNEASSSLDELKKRQEELRAELELKQAEFKAEMTEKREALKNELAEKRATLKAERVEKQEARKEERAKEKTKKSEASMREKVAEKIAKMEKRHQIALAKLENMSDTVESDLAKLGFQKGDRVEFIDSRDKHKMYGTLVRFWPYFRTFTTACAIKEEGTGKVYTRSIFNVKKVDSDYSE